MLCKYAQHTQTQESVASSEITSIMRNKQIQKKCKVTNLHDGDKVSLVKSDSCLQSPQEVIEKIASC